MPTGIMNNTQAVSLYAYKNNIAWDRVESNSDGNLKVNIENSNIAITTNGSTLNTSDATTHTKLDGVNSNLSGLATESTLANIDTTLTSGTIRIDPLGTTTQPTSDTTTHTKLDGVNSNLSALATESTLTTIAGDTTSLDGKITVGNQSDIIGGSLQQVLLYGKGSDGILHSANISNGGDLDVEIADFPKGQELMADSFPVVISSDQNDINIKVNSFKQEGSTNNIENNASIVNGAASSLSADISNMRECNIIVEDTSTTVYDGYDVEISGDNGTNYFTINNLYPSVNTAGTKRFAYVSLNVGGLDLLRIRNTSSTETYTNVNASVFGSP